MRWWLWVCALSFVLGTGVATQVLWAAGHPTWGAAATIVPLVVAVCGLVAYVAITVHMRRLGDPRPDTALDSVPYVGRDGRAHL